MVRAVGGGLYRGFSWDHIGERRVPPNSPAKVPPHRPFFPYFLPSFLSPSYPEGRKEGSANLDCMVGSHTQPDLAGVSPLGVPSGPDPRGAKNLIPHQRLLGPHGGGLLGPAAEDADDAAVIAGMLFPRGRRRNPPWCPPFASWSRRAISPTPRAAPAVGPRAALRQRVPRSCSR